MWHLNPGFLNKKKPLMVAVIGVGGTGSEVVSNLIHLHLGLQTLGYPGLHVVAFDPDKVSAANVVRQRYTMADLGSPKSETLIHRVNMAYAFGWEAVPERFKSSDVKAEWDLIISCVDTRKARKQIHGYVHAVGWGGTKFWLDCGNDRVTGQVILGTPRAKGKKLANHLPCATEVHASLMDTSIVDDDTPSCSALEALRKQDLMVNKMTATYAVNLLWRLFRDHKIDCHGYYFDLDTGFGTSIPVPQPDGGTARGDDALQRLGRRPGGPEV